MKEKIETIKSEIEKVVGVKPTMDWSIPVLCLPDNYDCYLVQYKEMLERLKKDNQLREYWANEFKKGNELNELK